MNLIDSLSKLILKPYIKRVSKKNLPELNGKIQLSGIDKNASLIRDKWGVSHIYAEELRDAFFVQGFAHAQDRLFQMEMLRRIARGTLCELFGEETLDTDRFSRSLGFSLTVDKDFDELGNSLKSHLSAYAEGVNAFIENNPKQLPVECKLLKLTPSPWTPQDTIAVSRMISWQMGFVWFGKLIRSQLESALGEKGRFLDMKYYSENPATLENEIEFNVFESSRELKKATGPWLNNIKGSNSWAISGKKTDTGFPYLCNDMHLASLQPSIWYENHLEGPGYKATGVSIPGIPLVMVGHNANIAWGMTLAFTEIQDLIYLDKTSFENKSFKDKNGKSYPVLEREETFILKGKKAPQKETFYQTDFGPVMHTLSKTSVLKMIMHSPALGKNKMLNGWWDLNNAKGWDDFVKAVEQVDAPALSITYADVYGNTGYFVSGKTPKRNAEDGSFPMPSHLTVLEKDYIPLEEKPHVFNAEKGFVLSSNNKIISDNYPYYLGKSWMDGFRASRLDTLLQGKDKFSITDMQRLQSDLICIAGIEIKNKLLSILGTDQPSHPAFSLFKNWKGEGVRESVGMSIYSVWKDKFLKNVLHELLGEDTYKLFRGTGPNEVLAPLTEFYGQEATTILKILNKPQQLFEQGNQKLTEYILKSFDESFRFLEQKLGKETQKWYWGKLHSLTFLHPFGKKRPFNSVFNQGPFPFGGDADTPCQAAWHPNTPYQGSLIFPSQRFIFDTSDWEKSLSILPPGQSERISSPYYDNQLDSYLNFQYKPMLWEKESILKNQAHRLDFFGKLNP